MYMFGYIYIHTHTYTYIHTYIHTYTRRPRKTTVDNFFTKFSVNDAF